jgi:hypothetical protein
MLVESFSNAGAKLQACHQRTSTPVINRLVFCNGELPRPREKRVLSFFRKSLNIHFCARVQAFVVTRSVHHELARVVLVAGV